MAKILTQCTTTDFRHVVEVSKAKKDGDPPPHFKPKERAALITVTALLHAGLSFEEIYQIREVIFWDNGEWVWKFKNTPEARQVKYKLSQSTSFDLIQEKLTQIGNKLNEVENATKDDI